MIIAIDFDGTIVADQYPEIGQLKPNAKEVIQQLKEDGHYIIIWTCRTGTRMYQVRDFLNEQEIPFDQINKSNPDNVEKYGIDTRKVYADVYIDDKGLHELPEDWIDIYVMIESKHKNNFKNKTT
jgi:histidinol phosphatase-like enzyme